MKTVALRGQRVGQVLGIEQRPRAVDARRDQQADGQRDQAHRGGDARVAALEPLAPQERRSAGSRGPRRRGTDARSCARPPGRRRRRRARPLRPSGSPASRAARTPARPRGSAARRRRGRIVVRTHGSSPMVGHGRRRAASRCPARCRATRSPQRVGYEQARADAGGLEHEPEREQHRQRAAAVAQPRVRARRPGRSITAPIAAAMTAISTARPPPDGASRFVPHADAANAPSSVKVASRIRPGRTSAPARGGVAAAGSRGAGGRGHLGHHLRWRAPPRVPDSS